MNTVNIPGMCVLTNHMRDLVTAENEWVLSHEIELVLELFGKTSRFNLHLYLTKNGKCYNSFLSESHTHYASENRFERFLRIKFLHKLTQRLVFPTF